MEYTETENGIFIKNNDYFKPELIFDCGQSFRFFETDGNIRTGVAFGSVVEIEKQSEGYRVTSYPSLSSDTLVSFFDLKRDYKETETALSGDSVMKSAMEFGRGIRILKQDFFEMLLTFIYSQRSSIPRIAKCVEKTAELFGKKIEYKGKVRYAFPKPEEMINADIFSLEPVKSGYRAEYIIDAVRKVNSGEINYDELKNLTYPEVKSRLLTIKGVGDKVADCVCLFAFGFFDAFPTDTWIKKAMDSLYSVKEADIKSASWDMFGSLSGIAQQYLFYYLKHR